METVNECPLIPRPTSRPDGMPIRCRQCGARCQSNAPAGHSFDRMCWGCSIKHAPRDHKVSGPELRAVDWAQGKPFDDGDQPSMERFYRNHQSAA